MKLHCENDILFANRLAINHRPGSRGAAVTGHSPQPIIAPNVEPQTARRSDEKDRSHDTTPLLRTGFAHVLNRFTPGESFRELLTRAKDFC